MDKMVDDDFGKDFINVGEEAAVESEEFGQDFPDVQVEQKAIEEGKPTWAETIGDVFVQTGRGVLKAFTWPADVLKAGMIGEALSDLDELEGAFERAGKPFDRDSYTKKVYEMAEFIPTQGLAEKGIESATGFSLEPKTEAGKRFGQAAEIATLNPGTLGRKALAGAGAALTTFGLEKAGVPGAELIGNTAGIATNLIKKGPKALSPAMTEQANTAQKHALPYLEYMTKENAPYIQGKLLKNTENQLKIDFNVSSREAVDRVIANKIPIKALRDKGINLDVMAENAYQQTEVLAKSRPQIIKTDQIVKAIDQEIAYIHSLAPSPSTAEKAAIKILEDERDILKVANPNSEQVIKQYQNYNSNVAQIYRKPEFTGVEKEVKNAYAFLNRELVTAIEQQGHSDVASAFKGANKIYAAKSQLQQSESILSKAFNGEDYSAKRLTQLLGSKKGKLLERNIGKDGVKDLKEIAKYGEEAQSKIGAFIKLDSPFVANEIGSWGNLAPFVLMPDKLSGGLLSIARVAGKHIQGKLLTRNGLRETYKMTLKHASLGQYNLLKKDFMKLEEGIAKEWGDTQTFIDEAMQEFEFEGF